MWDPQLTVSNALCGTLNRSSLSTAEMWDLVASFGVVKLLSDMVRIGVEIKVEWGSYVRLRRGCCSFEVKVERGHYVKCRCGNNRWYISSWGMPLVNYNFLWWIWVGFFTAPGIYPWYIVIYLIYGIISLLNFILGCGEVVLPLS